MLTKGDLLDRRCLNGAMRETDSAAGSSCPRRPSPWERPGCRLAVRRAGPRARRPPGSARSPWSARAAGEARSGARIYSRTSATSLEMVGLCDINPIRLETAKDLMGAACPTFTDFDRMLRETAAGPRHRHDHGLLPRQVHRPGDAGRLRRDHRETDVHGREDGPGDHRHRAADRQEPDRHFQLPVRPRRLPDQGDPDVPGDRRRDLGRFPLVPGRLSRRRLFPPLARLQAELGVAPRPQGVASFRRHELVAGARSRSRSTPTESSGSTATTDRSGASGAWRCPHKAELRVLLGHHREPGGDEPLCQGRGRRRLSSATPASSGRRSTSGTR